MKKLKKTAISLTLAFFAANYGSRTIAPGKQLQFITKWITKK